VVRIGETYDANMLYFVYIAVEESVNADGELTDEVALYLDTQFPWLDGYLPFPEDI